MCSSKQFLQAEALSFCQIDACRLGGVNEVLSVLFVATKSGVPVCPHGGGVGRCEHVQHLALVDYIRLGASREEHMIEYVDHLHEHVIDPVRVVDSRSLPPKRPGYKRRDAAKVDRRLRLPDRYGVGTANRLCDDVDAEPWRKVPVGSAALRTQSPSDRAEAQAHEPLNCCHNGRFE